MTIGFIEEAVILNSINVGISNIHAPVTSIAKHVKELGLKQSIDRLVHIIHKLIKLGLVVKDSNNHLILTEEGHKELIKLRCIISSMMVE